MALGAVSFWLPDTVCHAITDSKFNGTDVKLITVLMPLTLLAMYVFLKRKPENEAQRNVGLPMMLGVWMLGGFFISVGGLLGGGYAGRTDGFQSALDITVMGLVPPLTYILSAYDGSIFALLVATLVATAIVVGMRWNRPKNRAKS